MSIFWLMQWGVPFVTPPILFLPAYTSLPISAEDLGIPGGETPFGNFVSDLVSVGHVQGDAGATLFLDRYTSFDLSTEDFSGPDGDMPFGEFTSGLVYIGNSQTLETLDSPNPDATGPPIMLDAYTSFPLPVEPISSPFGEYSSDISVAPSALFLPAYTSLPISAEDLGIPGGETPFGDFVSDLVSVGHPQMYVGDDVFLDEYTSLDIPTKDMETPAGDMPFGNLTSGLVYIGNPQSLLALDVDGSGKAGSVLMLDAYTSFPAPIENARSQGSDNPFGEYRSNNR